ncbi:uncharacterized protein LACBIDRAFT_334401 [Laccaria bicolor S238N-H82]|uniref:Predicted protein n=1 Tax=Laccaria bicolor (strain S238N-H82 / ATCC MYA-4686) TaxID=486041 RepID=B0DZ38_LACBS|nr:uncharacterized protein LACBIDRAFT_334401 [Laccaria bicolor S238N-H82]EDR00166.1 predicted protein [Laccaria bicolor S238N-H82]|eukprot:XP_001889223.1 predicted protein [Laccaria bicolor S238N-H82]
MHPCVNFIFPGLYTKPTYTYSGLSFDELPAAAREFLVELELTPPNYGACDKQKFYDLHLAHMEKLWSTIHSVYTKIVTLRQAVAGMTEDDLDHVDVIVHNLKEVLIPEWHAHLDRFFAEFDALIWVEEHKLGMEDGARDSAVDQIMVSVIKRFDDYYEALTEAQAKREAAQETNLPILVCLPEQQPSHAATKYHTWPRERMTTWNGN